MTFILTLLLTLVVVTTALLLFWKLGSPVYRVERHNIINLLELVVSGQATEADWDVFCAYPIRHDPDLALIQQRCLEISEKEYVGGSKLLFSSAGMVELGRILEQLKAEDKHREIQDD